LEPLFPGYVGMTLKSEGRQFEVVSADNYEYRDPIDGSVAKNQVFFVLFVFF
jgi:hypothetical protein